MMRTVVHFAASIKKLMKRIDRVRGNRRCYIYIIDVLIDVSTRRCIGGTKKILKKSSTPCHNRAQKLYPSYNIMTYLMILHKYNRDISAWLFYVIIYYSKDMYATLQIYMAHIDEKSDNDNAHFNVISAMLLLSI